jgi:hypothetical protein
MSVAVLSRRDLDRSIESLYRPLREYFLFDTAMVADGVAFTDRQASRVLIIAAGAAKHRPAAPEGRCLAAFACAAAMLDDRRRACYAA